MGKKDLRGVDFVEREFPDGELAWLPIDLELEFPSEDETSLDISQRHYLISIPWRDDYLDLVPNGELSDFFEFVRPYLGVRTTDVHTAVCLGMLPEYLDHFIEKGVDERVVGLALVLHDCGWGRLSEAEIASSLGVEGLALSGEALAPKERHAVEGAVLAEQLIDRFEFQVPLSGQQKELIIRCVRYHDKPEEVAGKGEKVPLEVRVLVDLDHIWAFTRLNFWQDTVRKGIKPETYYKNMKADLDDYFVTDFGKQKARQLLEERRKEIAILMCTDGN